jgi:hypothetical protein
MKRTIVLVSAILVATRSSSTPTVAKEDELFCSVDKGQFQISLDATKGRNCQSMISNLKQKRYALQSQKNLVDQYIRIKKDEQYRAGVQSQLNEKIHTVNNLIGYITSRKNNFRKDVFIAYQKTILFHLQEDEKKYATRYQLLQNQNNTHSTAHISQIQIIQSQINTIQEIKKSDNKNTFLSLVKTYIQKRSFEGFELLAQ